MKKLLIAANTEFQLERFCRIQNIPRPRVQRVTSEQHLRGYVAAERPPILLLPSWNTHLPPHCLDSLSHGLKWWVGRGGTTLVISESEFWKPQAQLHAYYDKEAP